MKGFGTAQFILALLQSLLVAVLAPFLDGLIRKTVARVQSRKGPPLLQSYYDLLKLLCKEDIEVSEVPLVQRLVAVGSVAVMMLMAAVIPLGGRSPLSGVTDAILVVHLLTLAAMTTLIAGAATGNVFSMIGVNREMLLMIGLEPLLAIAVFIGVIHTGGFGVDQALIGGIYKAERLPISGLVLLLLLVAAFPAYLQRAPFDLVEAETEIIEGPFLEYSGPKLALLKWAQMMRTLLYSALLVDLALPWIYRAPIMLRVGLFWCGTAAVVVLFTVVAALHARYRIDQAIRWFGAMLAIGTAAIWLAACGY